MKISRSWMRFGRRRRPARSPLSIFLSRPTAVTVQQEAFCVELQRLLEERGVRGRTLGITDYPVRAPLGEVLDLMLRCDGVLVLGLVQANVETGVAKPGAVGEKRIDGAQFATPWNQIEAGMAFALGLPVFLVREARVTGGVFDVGSSDRFLHQAELTTQWLQSRAFRQPLERWIQDVRSRGRS